MQLVEILDTILEQLAPKQHNTPYTPQIQQTLSACLSVSRKVRHLAAERLFQILHIKSSMDPRRLDTLLRIVDSPSQEWMSIRPFIRNLIFSIESFDSTGATPTIVQSFIPDYFVPLFNSLAVSRGNHGSRITHFEFRVSPPHILIFNQALEDAVLRFMKLPSLLSLQIHGASFTRDFLLGTHFREVEISGYGIDLNLGSNDLYTEELGADVASEVDDQLDYPSLRKFRTDLVWPRGLPDRALEFIFRDLASLSIEINISHAFTKAEVLMRKAFSTLTTLIITYNFDGYEAELPTTWSIDFGELRALETLEFNWRNSLTSVHQNTIARGCRPLAGMQSLLDTIGTPMRSLTTIRWNFRYLATSLPPDTLSQWLQSDIRWRKLDQSLSSDFFPGLYSVSLDFSPIAVFSRDAANADHGDNARLTSLRFHFDLVESIVSENRQRVFPNLTASLGDNFRFKAAGEITFTDNEASNY